MSHLRERLEKNCLNCNTEVQGRYCQNCGQENIETKETVWHLIAHFFKDITHFDGKFFSTLKYLIVKPGFASKEYMIGRRASYVNPVKMYIFTSAFFFLLFFSVFKIKNNNIQSSITLNGKTFDQVRALDSLAFDEFTTALNKEDGKPAAPMKRDDFKKYFDSTSAKSGIHFSNGRYKSKAQYDSLLESGVVKDGWIKRRFIYREIEINEKFRDNPKATLGAIGNVMLHSLPQMLFILLPLFAFILKLLYIRRKDYYYVNHGIFSIHYYIFCFIGMIVIFGLGKLNSWVNWGAITFLQVALAFGLLFYLYKAMRNFYQQRRAKTVFKFLIFCLLILITIMFLFIGIILFSFFKI